MQKSGKVILENYAERLNPFLSDFFKESKVGGMEYIEEFCQRGGKRLRPALVYYGYRLLGKRYSARIIKASLAIEFTHTFLLIHDDIMDESMLRRGGPTLHKFFVKQGPQNGAARFGESMAILAGDMCQCLALDVLSAINFPSDLKLRVIKKLNDTVIGTILGQELDIQLAASNISTTKDILRMYRLKTAQYTFECPLQMGVILADGKEKDLQIVSDYAIPLGIAFQIQDDILGLFGDKKTIGKGEGADLKQGKQTLLIAKALEKSSKKEIKIIRQALNNISLTKQKIEEVRRIVKESGALSYAKRLSKIKFQQAKKALQKMRKQNYNKEAIDTLYSIANFTIDRNK